MIILKVFWKTEDKRSNCWKDRGFYKKKTRRREGNAINWAVIPNPRIGIKIKFASTDPASPPKRSDEYKEEIILFWSSTLYRLAYANIPDVRNPDIISAVSELKKVLILPELIRYPNNKYIIIDEVINKIPVNFSR